MLLSLVIFFVALVLLGLLLAAVIAALLLVKRNVHVWLPAFVRGDWKANYQGSETRHLMFCFVDHYEPQWAHPDYQTECDRVARWHQEYPELVAGLADADGRPPIHTYFYPEEEYRPEHLDKLVDLCRMGMGEIEIHLHHDNDTEAGLREKLSRFTETLATRHGALPRHPETGQPQWAFIHGNWTLDNSGPDGRNCGVNNELIVLREEGCYADFTLPSAPDPAQTRTINSIYFATDDPHKPKSHDSGDMVRVGGETTGDLMIIQGPLGFMWHSRKFGFMPRIENADVRVTSPATTERIDSWVNTGVHVRGKPEWVFVKIHTHGAQEPDMPALLGPSMRKAYEYLEQRYNDGQQWALHYVSAREMYNIVCAAQAGETGNPGQFRDYRIARPSYEASVQAAVNA